MSIKGGYKLIDLKESKLTVGGDGVTVKGIYNSIENSYNKPLILTGINIGGIERNDVFIDFAVNSGNMLLIFQQQKNHNHKCRFSNSRNY